MKEFLGKRLLLLGGSKPYVKVAKAAKEAGAQVIVVDKMATDEILGFADDYLKCSLLDIDAISDWCCKNPVDGVVNLCVDFAQRTYQVLCAKFDLPCFYSMEQVDILANKVRFKKALVESGLNIIKTYDEKDIIEDRVNYPIIIKPSEGSGSRGATTCIDKTEALAGLKKAKNESRSGDIIIEEFIQDAQEIQITYFLCRGNTYVIRTADSYRGNEKDGLERIVACAISPSRYTSAYFENAHRAVLSMVKNLGLHDGPFFMQGFVRDGQFLFFDPGCRFPGVDFDSIYQKEYGFDIAKMIIHFAFTGNMPNIDFPSEMYNLHGKKAAVLFPVMKAGIISRVSGLNEIEKNDSVFSISKRHLVGDEIQFTHDVNQRYGEFDIISSDINELKKQIQNIQRTLCIENTNGEEMLYSHFSVSNIV